MHTLRFSGVICDGVKKFAKMEIPGRATLPQAPKEWPEELYRGSLNVWIRANGYPADFVQHRLPVSVETLDNGLFEPAFEIPHDQIGGNTLSPNPEMPRRGDAQVWPAEIHRDIEPLFSVSCWTLRRFGANVGEQLELVSEERLRDRDLPNGTPVTVHLFGRWREA